MSSRKVSRVLIMLEYGPDDPANGEVFDLTALCSEMALGARYSASLGVRIEAQRTYRPPPDVHHELSISFSGDAGNWVHGATHLDDVVNAAMPDGERVQAIKAKAARCSKKAEDLTRDAMAAKLEQVAAIRHQHPIARVESAPIAQLTTSDASTT